MSDLLSIGATGVRAYQTALNVVGENIANASTRGYVRRDARLTELSAGAGRSVLSTSTTVGGGVFASGVDRAWDAFRATAVRQGTADSARTGQSIVWLERIEQALTGAAVPAALTRFFNAGQAIAADPTGTAPRAGLIDAASGVATAFATTSQALSAVESDLRASAKLAAGSLNSYAAGLAEANTGLSRVRAGSNEQAQLLDQRDRMIDQIATLASINVQMDDRGVATVRLNDGNGPVLVDGPLTKPIEVAFNASGHMAVTADPFGTPQPVALRGGALAGFAEASLRLTDARAQIGQTATDFANGVNTVQAGGIDLDGQPGAPLFDTSAGDGSISALPIAGRQIAAARPWTSTPAAANTGAATLQATTSGNPLASTRFTLNGGVLTATDPVTSNVIGSAPYTPGTPVVLAGLSVTVSGTAADGDSFSVAATKPGSRDNGNLQALAALRTSGRFEGKAEDLISTNASVLSARKQVAEAQGVILDGAIAAQDAMSGVDLDGEAVELMRFQQAYQASSRIIQVSRDIFQSLLSSIG